MARIHKPLYIFIAAGLGIMIGLGIMLVISIFEEKIKV